MSKRRPNIKCFYCQGHFPPGNMTKDHFIPQHVTKINHGNLVPACRPCNELKANRLPTDGEMSRFEKWYGHFPGYERGEAALEHAKGQMRNRDVQVASRSAQAYLRIQNQILAAKQRMYVFIEAIAVGFEEERA